MSQRTPVSILIVNEHSEEIKLATIGFRGFFSDCRVDVAYSAEEARILSSKHALEWTFVLIDDGCLSGNNAALIDDLKRQATYTAVLLQSDGSDAAAAIRAMQAGADFFLAKQSPAFLTELLFCAREAVEKRDLRIAVARADVRHQQLLESLTDLFYELDAEGNFLVVGSKMLSLLGYAPQELIGSSYTTIFSTADHAAARFRFNERRSGARNAHGIELTFRTKPSPDRPERSVSAQIRARGMYDSRRRFLGTVGLVRIPSSNQAEQGMAQRPAQQAARFDKLQLITRQISALSQELGQPLAALRDETDRLLDALRTAGFDQRLTQLAEQATIAMDLRNRLTQALQTIPSDVAEETINDLLEEVLASLRLQDEGRDKIGTAYAADLPAYYGDRAQAIDCFRRLLLSAQTMLIASGRRRQMLVRTGVIGGTVEIECLESEQETEGEIDLASQPEKLDLTNLYRLVSTLGGTLDLSMPAAGPLRIAVRLTVADETQAESPMIPTSVAPPPQIETEAAPPPSPQPPVVPIQEQAKDRRAAPRIPTTLPARISVESTVWNGTVANLSPGGACIRLSSDFPSFESQNLSVVLRTAVGILELNASASARLAQESTGQQRTVPVQLILVFQPPRPAEASILSSLIEAAQEQSLSFSLDLQLTARPRDASPADAFRSADPQDDDRREAIRVALALPVRLETEEPPEQGRLIARAVNISRHGACLVVKAAPEELRGSVLLHFASGRTAGHPGPHEPGAPDSALPARIVWSVPDSTASNEFRPNHAAHAARIGVRFLSLTPYAERELTRLVRQYLTSSQSSSVPAEQASVTSIHRECRNPRGQAIAIMDDHLRQPIVPETPILIISPGYGQTARDYSALSYFLAHHRLRVLRYDHSNHVGLSDGELQNTTLRGMQTDLAKVVEFVHHTWPTARVVVLASDLSARAALKMAVQAHPVDLLLLVNPVIDVGALLMTVHEHDLVADYRYGLRRGITNLLGFNVNLDQFVGDTVAGHLTDLASALEDVRLLRSPLAIITSPRDESSPLPPSDLPHAFLTALGTQTRMLSVPSPLAGHPAAWNEPQPAAFRQILEQIASILTWPLSPVEAGPAAQEALVRQQQLELEQTRLQRNFSQISREAMGLAHLQQLPQLANLHEYRKLLDDLYAFLSPLSPGMAIVDAGIGQSDVTRAMLVNHTYRTRQRGLSLEQPPLLVGLGRSEDQVQQARQNVQTLQRELTTGKSGGVTAIPPLTIAWMRTDWTQALPFRSRSIHRIVCNLSLPFVNSPRVTLQEWFRVLHPEGRLVFTAFHRDTDLSPLYRRHLRLANQDEFGPQSQPVLHYLGRLREAIRHGILHTFDRVSLTSLLRQSGQLSFRIDPIFDGQAFVVIVGKRISSGSL